MDALTEQALRRKITWIVHLTTLANWRGALSSAPFLRKAGTSFTLAPNKNWDFDKQWIQWALEAHKRLDQSGVLLKKDMRKEDSHQYRLTDYI